MVGNLIGTTRAGTGAVPNRFGVSVTGPRNVIGGAATTSGNVISGNSSGGIVITGTNATANSILSNRVFSNGGLGIDLGNNGVTADDSGDGDAGPNNLQNFPVLTPTGSGVEGMLNSVASSPYTIQFFANQACDGSGNGEGETLLGTVSVNTDANGNATIPLFPTAAGQVVTATATVAMATETPPNSRCA